MFLRTFIVATLGLILVWQIIARSFGAYFALTDPKTALLLNPSEAWAHLEMARDELAAVLRARGTPAETDGGDASDGMLEDRIGAWAGAAARGTAEQPESNALAAGIDLDPTQVERIQQSARAVLFSEPFNAQGARILGLLADASGDEDAAARFMQAAARRSIRESVALFWLLRKTYDAQDFAGAAYYADALLRTRNRAFPLVVPLLARMAEDKSAAGEVKSLLAVNPPWRERFLSEMTRSMMDARTPLDLLLSLRETETPPSGRELNAYLKFLVGRKFYELAYYAWLQFLPPEELGALGFLTNGSFEAPPSGAPFDWNLTPSRGVAIDIRQKSGSNERALVIEFGQGRVDMRPVTQMLMLAPGTYEFAGVHRGEIAGRRGLLWQVACANDARTRLGESAMLLGLWQSWQPFTFTFTVPEEGCRAQNLRLLHDARSASEKIVSGAVWYDDIRINRVTETPQAPGGP